MGIKSTLKKIVGIVIHSNWYPNKKILLESIPDMGSQTYPVFQYMLKEGLNEKYKLIWLVKDKNQFSNVKIKNVKFLNINPKTKIDSIKFTYANMTARAMLYSHEYIRKYYDKQILFFLRHGPFMKSRLKHTSIDEVNESDACVCTSDFFTNIDSNQLRIPPENMVHTGFPTDDFLFEEEDFTKKLFPKHTFSKIIMWLPTFRKAKSGNRLDSQFDFPLGIPCVYTQEDCNKLNECLKKENILLVLKPHPAQDLSIVKSLDLSNFKIIYDDNLKNADLQLYQFLGSTDAMITDYSSVYYDYLLTKNPVGITLDDFEEYTKDTGFVFENFFDMIVGEYIKNTDDLIKFIEKIAKGEDDKLELRERTCNLAFKYRDNKATQRVYEHLIKMLNERYSENL